MLIRVCGVIASTSWVVIRSRTTRSMRERPTRIWFWISSPTVRRRRLPKWSMSSAPWLGLAGVETHDVLDGGDDVVLGQRAGALRHRDAELLVDLVAADLGQVVALRVEEEVLQQRLRATRASAARPDAACGRCRAAPRPARRCGPSPGWRRTVGDHWKCSRMRSSVPAERLEQHGDRLTALAVDADADGVALVDVELQPRTAARDDLGAEDVLVRRLVQASCRSRRRGSGRAGRRRRARCR